MELDSDKFSVGNQGEPVKSPSGERSEVMSDSGVQSESSVLDFEELQSERKEIVADFSEPLVDERQESISDEVTVALSQKEPSSTSEVPIGEPNDAESGNRKGYKIQREDGSKVLNQPCRRTINVRMCFGGQIQAFDCGNLNLDIGDWVVVKVGDVVRLALVTSKPIIWPADQGTRRVFLPMDRCLLRAATAEDLTRQAENQLKERDDFDYCFSRIAVQKLEMKLVAVEITFDNYKTIFYYTADERVDFRLLVKELVSRFRTRVEMRQIGVRHEARLVGGMGVCGRDFCCGSFLANFAPVSVRMAKEQNLSLNPVKISGVCGRLMCCLAFENYGGDSYQSRNHVGAPSASEPDLDKLV